MIIASCHVHHFKFCGEVFFFRMLKSFGKFSSSPHLISFTIIDNIPRAICNTTPTTKPFYNNKTRFWFLNFTTCTIIREILCFSLHHYNIILTFYVLMKLKKRIVSFYEFSFSQKLKPNVYNYCYHKLYTRLQNYLMTDFSCLVFTVKSSKNVVYKYVSSFYIGDDKVQQPEYIAISL